MEGSKIRRLPQREHSHYTKCLDRPARSYTSSKSITRQTRTVADFRRLGAACGHCKRTRPARSAPVGAHSCTGEWYVTVEPPGDPTPAFGTLSPFQRSRPRVDAAGACDSRRSSLRDVPLVGSHHGHSFLFLRGARSGARATAPRTILPLPAIQSTNRNWQGHPIDPPVKSGMYAGHYL